MRQLLTEAFKRLEGQVPERLRRVPAQPVDGRRQDPQPARPRVARASTPSSAQEVMGDFYQPGPLGAVRVVTFSGRKKHPVRHLGRDRRPTRKQQAFDHFYSPAAAARRRRLDRLARGRADADHAGRAAALLPGRARPAGSARPPWTSSPRRALANLLAAVSSGKLPNVCVVLTDLSGSAYGAGSAAISDVLGNLEKEANRSGPRAIDPVRLNSRRVLPASSARGSSRSCRSRT